MFSRHFDVLKSRFLPIFVIFWELFIFKAIYSPLKYARWKNNIAYVVGNLMTNIIEPLHVSYILFFAIIMRKMYGSPNIPLFVHIAHA